MGMPSTRRRDVILGACSSLFGLVLLLIVLPYGIQQPPMRSVTSPGTWPSAIAVLIIAFGVWIIIEALTIPAAVQESESTPAVPKGAAMWARLGIIFLILLLPYLLVDFLGMIGVAVLSVLLLTVPFEERRPWILAVLLTVPVIAYYFFSKVAQVQFPLGVFG